MSMLERAVADLADALDSLETKISAKLDDAGDNETAAMRRHIRSARGRADAASKELGAIITEMKVMIGDKDAKED